MKWAHFLHRDMSVLFECLAQRAGVDYLESTLNLHGLQIKNRKIDHSEIYHDPNEISRLKDEIERRGMDYLIFLSNACERQCKEIVDITKQSLESTTDKALDSFFREQCKLMTFLPLFPGVIEPIISDMLDDIVEKYSGNLICAKELKDKLAKPSKPYEITLEEIERYAIASRIQKDQYLLFALKERDTKTLKPILEDYRNRFGWIETRHFKGDVWTIDDAAERIKQVIGLDCHKKYCRLKNKQTEEEKEISRICEEAGISSEDRQKLKIIRDFIYLRTKRKDAMSEANYHMKSVFEGIATSSGLITEDLVYLTPDEIKDLAKNPSKGSNYQRSIGDRKKGFVLMTCDGITRIFTDSFEEHSYQKATTESSVNGECTFGGKVEGIGRRIMDKKEIQETKEGEIVVTPMTSPDYAIIMSRVTGIITNEGGVTCHAAQISREYRIPCIIGTMNATNVFKTGDKLFLNSIEGYAEKMS